MLKKAFTLIELLVVIAIIGILSSVVVASLNSARVKARDARRVADLKQIQVALELYYDANNKYPAALTALVGSANGASLPSLPADPFPPATYKYAVNASSATAYHLGATLEQATGATTLDDADRDMNSSASGTGPLSWPTDITGSTPFDGVDPVYDVSNQ